MFLLITNDDGISSPGLHALAKELQKYHEILIVAPDDQRSACSHSITLERPLKIKEHKIEGLNAVALSIDGTPADCVRVALDKLTNKKVDVVLSGINRGFNLGMDVLYSGTVSAAVEASINKIPALAVSTEFLENEEQYKLAAKYALKILSKALEKKIQQDIVLNINVPNINESEIKGVKVCRIGNMMYGSYFIERLSEAGERLFDIKGNINKPLDTDTDRFFIEEGYVTLTPLHYDLTNYTLLKNVDRWFN